MFNACFLIVSLSISRKMLHLQLRIHLSRWETELAMSEWLQLQHRLYPRLQQIRTSRSKLFVTVIRATHLQLPGVHYSPPQAVVALGHHERRSPLGEAFGSHPIFDWRVDLPFEGHESHLVFQVICEGRLMGSCLLPLGEVLSAESFHRALPLGEAREAGAQRPELFVRVSTTLEGDMQVPVLQEQSAERLRMKTSQVRVTLRSLRVEESLAIDKGTLAYFGSLPGLPSIFFLGLRFLLFLAWFSSRRHNFSSVSQLQAITPNSQMTSLQTFQLSLS